MKNAILFLICLTLIGCGAPRAHMFDNTEDDILQVEPDSEQIILDKSYIDEIQSQI